MKTVTKKDAEKFAKEKYGANGIVWREKEPLLNRMQCWVGFDSGFARHIRGYGDTWKQAIERAKKF